MKSLPFKYFSDIFKYVQGKAQNTKGLGFAFKESLGHEMMRSARSS